MKIQQHGFMFKLDVSLLDRDRIEGMVADVFSVEESANMLTNLSLVIELKDGLDLISLNEN